jgi:hypothetical protein
MPLATTATGPTNVYFLEDDPGLSTGVAGQNQALSGSGTGAQLSPEFTAPSAAAALTVAHIFATCFQRPVRLVTKYAPASGTPPWTLVLGAVANVAITSVPSGVGY